MMWDAIVFIFAIITVAMAVMGLFVMFKEILREDDDKITEAFQQGLEAGMNAQLGKKQTQHYISDATITKALRKRS